jgi:hypothetical protein
MDLLNKVKDSLAKNKRYDFSSEIFDDEMITIIYDVVYETEKVLLNKADSNPNYEDEKEY